VRRYCLHRAPRVNDRFVEAINDALLAMAVADPITEEQYAVLTERANVALPNNVGTCWLPDCHGRRDAHGLALSAPLW
jgi:hypothetical protein